MSTESEIKALNTYLKRMYPFIVNVDSFYKNKRISHVSRRKTQETTLNIYVSPTHFCELMDDRVERKLVSKMLSECSQLLPSILPGTTSEDRFKFIFFPDIDKVTIFNDLEP
jgi:hypothetical protein